MALVTFTDKVDSRIINVPAINKIVASDIKQLKDGVNTNEAEIIALDAQVVRITGNQSIAGAKTFSDAATFASTVSATDGLFSGDVYLLDNKKAIFGANSDLEIYHGTSDSRIQENVGNLSIKSVLGAVTLSAETGISLRVNETDIAIQMLSLGAVELRYNNIKKLETTSTGVKVTGDLSSTTLTPTTITTGNVPYKSAGALLDSPISTDGTDVTFASSVTAGGDIISTGTSFIGAAITSSYTPNDGVFGGKITNVGGFKIQTNGQETLTLSAVGGNMTVRGEGNFGSSVNATDGNFSGQIAIGTNIGSYGLEVNNGGSNGLKVQSGNSVNDFSLLVSDNSDNSLFSIKGDGAATFASSVGVGVTPKTTSTSWRHLQIGGAGNIIGRSSSLSDAIFANNYYINSSNQDSYITAGGSARMFFNDNVISFEQASSGSADAPITWSTPLTLNSNQSATFASSVTATAFNTSSDYRLKEDSKDFNGLEMISNIPVYDYKWKANEDRAYGVMAHELQEILPQAVTSKKDGKEMQAVDYSKIVPLLIKSIQELSAEIELLKNK